MNSRTSGFHRFSAVTLAALLLAGCSTITEVLQGDKVDYKSAAKASRGNPLEVPPDLSTLPRDDRYGIPGTATLSDYTQQQAGKGAPSTAPLLPTVSEARLEQAGGQRWLNVRVKADDLWPVLKDFWQENGFLVNLETPDTGIMETDWAENRAKIPQDLLRSTVGKVFDDVYSTGERDKFRTRLERAPNGSTEVYISHRGMIEVYSDQKAGTTVWQPRASDPELEAEFLRRLLVRLGTESDRAKEIVAAAPQAPRARLAGNAVEVNETFDRAWRRVGLALDRVGFTVEDRDRTNGTYFVRYIDPELDKKTDQKPGFFGRIFGSSSKETKVDDTDRYRVLVREEGGMTRVTIQNNQGATDTRPAAGRILSLLHEQLK